MKLAEALQERADLNRLIEQLTIRIENNALVQEGEKPAEDPKTLIPQLDAALERLQYLMAAINLTNCQTKVDGRTLTEMIAEKDALTLRLARYREITDAASRIASRATRSEIRILPTIDVRKLQKSIDADAKQLRLTDNALQAANWSTDLIEK